MFPIKAAGITHLSDARYFAVSAQLIGFNCCVLSPNYLPVTKIAELAQWVAGVHLVAECDNALPSTINELLLQFSFQYIQTQLNDTQLKGLYSGCPPLIRHISIKRNDTPNNLISNIKNNYLTNTKYILLDYVQNKLPYSQLNLPLYQIISQLRCNANFKNIDIIVHTPLNSANVLNFIQTVCPNMLQINGTPELELGLKNFEETQDILETLGY